MHHRDFVLGWALAFFVTAIVAAMFGFGGVATTAVDLTRALFFLFLGAAVISFVIDTARGRSP